MAKKNTTHDEQVAANTSAIQLLGKDLGYMRAGIDDLKDSVEKLRLEITDGFVSKEQLRRLEERINGLDERIKSFENAQAWVVKIVFGAVILALLALIGIKT